jgi:hypothetical protein
MALQIGGGITIGAGVGILPGFSTATAGLLLHLDAGNTASYPGSGTTWTDLVSSKVFTLFGSSTPTYSSTKGGYINFVHSSGHYAASPGPNLGSLSTWTVEAWVSYTGSQGSNPAIVSEVFGSNKINYVIGTPDVGGLVAPTISVGAYPGSWYAATPGFTPTLNAWYQVVGTYDGSSFNLYINGTLRQSSSATVTTTTSANGIVLMKRWDNPDHWGGGLGVVRIYNGALTSTQITGNWISQRDRFGI